MTTSTPDDGVSRTRIEVEAGPDGSRARLRTRTTGAPELPLLRPVILGATAVGARVSLVPEGAMLLAGDRIEVTVEVGPGTALEISEPAGTVAYDMQGGSASWDVRVVLHPDARLVWHGEPFVASAGSRTRRTTRVELGTGAGLALRETLVLGRHGEWPGVVEQRLTATTADGVPLLVEQLDVGVTPDPAVLGTHRVLGSVLLLGRGVGPDLVSEDRYDLDGEGTLWRRLGREVHRATPAAAWAHAVAALDLTSSGRSALAR